MSVVVSDAAVPVSLTASSTDIVAGGTERLRRPCISGNALDFACIDRSGHGDRGWASTTLPAEW